MYSVIDPSAFDAIPELGMGFHFGEMQAAESSSERIGLIVLNAELALAPKDITDFERLNRWLLTQGVGLPSGIKFIMAPEPAPMRKIVPSENIDLFKFTFGRFIANVDRFDMRSRIHASPPFQLLTKGPEEFVRFSAFQNDRRVRPDGSILPGTYVTSKRDTLCAPSGYAVVGRYALPNPVSATNRFDMLVPGGTSGLVGTVSPAFGQSGGGVEIEFVNGTPPGSVKQHATIPEY